MDDSDSEKKKTVRFSDFNINISGQNTIWAHGYHSNHWMCNRGNARFMSRIPRPMAPARITSTTLDSGTGNQLRCTAPISHDSVISSVNGSQLRSTFPITHDSLVSSVPGNQPPCTIPVTHDELTNHRQPAMSQIFNSASLHDGVYSNKGHGYRISYNGEFAAICGRYSYTAEVGFVNDEF